MNVTVTDVVGAGFLVRVPILPERTDASQRLHTELLVRCHGALATRSRGQARYVGFYNFGGRVQLVVDVFGVFTWS